MIRKLCYMIIRTCNITSIENWMYVENSIMEDIKSSEDFELIKTVLRCIPSIFGLSKRYLDFYFDNKEEFLKLLSSEDIYIKIESLNLIKLISKTIKTNINIDFNENLINLFGEYILKLIQDVEQEVSFTSFSVVKK
jgi:hypothetical protein